MWSIRECLMNTHLAEDRGCETCDDPATEADRKLGGTAQRAPRLLRHCAEGELVAELVHGELSNGVRDLSASHRHVVTQSGREPWHADGRGKGVRSGADGPRLRQRRTCKGWEGSRRRNLRGPLLVPGARNRSRALWRILAGIRGVCALPRGE